MTIAIATDATTVREARARYFTDNGFDPAYDEPWVKLKAGPLPLWFPNAPGRVRAVKLHDVHHLATGYDTSWSGEAAIAAWELASGCGRYAWAWGLNLSALPIGLAIAPRTTWRAFARGRRTTNLYRLCREVDDALLGTSVRALRAELRLDRREESARGRDRVAFAALCIASIAPTLVVPGFLAWLLW